MVIDMNHYMDEARAGGVLTWKHIIIVLLVFGVFLVVRWFI